MIDRSVLSPGAEPKRHPLSRVRGIKRLPSLVRLILVFPIAVLLAVPAPVYAYAEVIIQDMGYYPYGSPFFSDLTHYVRSGDFIQALLRDAQDLNQYAFA